jgi:hypothetical protein
MALETQPLALCIGSAATVVAIAVELEHVAWVRERSDWNMPRSVELVHIVAMF